MATLQAPYRFFLGGTTPTGFRDTVSQLYDPEEGWRVFLIKGAPGSGKSTLLKRVYERCGEQGEVFLCGADPRSLDGVRIPSKRLMVLDATAPHAVEPRLWGACEQLVPLATCTDERLLYAKRETVAALTRECRELHARCRRLVAGAAALLQENGRLQREATDEEQMRTFAARLAAQEWEKQDTRGREERRFLSAVTPDGVVPLFETAQALCPRIHVICDEQGTVAPMLLQRLKALAVADGQTVIACPCPLFPDSKTEHLLLPEVGTAFLTANRFHPVDFPVYRRIHVTRFIDTDRLREHKQQLAFRQKSAAELIDGAVEALAQARALHTQLEQLTAEATDWDAVSQMSDAFLERMEL